LLNLSSAKSSACRDQTPRKSQKSNPVGEVGLEKDRAAATAAVLADDGFGLGVCFRGDRATVSSKGLSDGITSLSDLERQFAIAP
jgi:hypothetical protein